MSDKPLSFNTDMVHSLLDDRKLQTRRIVRPQPEYRESKTISGHYGTFFHGWNLDHEAVKTSDIIKYCPHGQTGDLLWVKERVWLRPERTQLQIRDGADTWPPYIYFADDPEQKDWCNENGWLHRTSMICPRIASRITLEILNIRFERLQDISEHDATYEGIEKEWDGTAYWYKNYFAGSPAMFKRKPIVSFRSLWDPIYHKRGLGWQDNPYVWAIDFKVFKEGIVRHAARGTELEVFINA